MSKHLSKDKKKDIVKVRSRDNAKSKSTDKYKGKYKDEYAGQSNDKDTDIDIYEDKQHNMDDHQLPFNFITIGEVKSDDIKIYIRQDVYKCIEDYSASGTTREVGGILIGKYIEQSGKISVIVSDFIEARYTDTSASTLTFTNDTWDYVHEEYQMRFPDKKIIGWQHTHLDNGIFLSSYDMYIQENFFNLPFQIAYVIDPIKCKRGFFAWKNGKVEELRGFYIYDEVGEKIKVSMQEVVIADKKPRIKASEARILDILLIVLAMTCVVLAVTAVAINDRYHEVRRQNNEEHDNLLRTIEKLERAEGWQESYNNLLSKLDEQQLILDKQVSELEELKKYINENSGLDNNVNGENIPDALPQDQYIDGDSTKKAFYFIQYEVKAGDSLYNICTKYGISYEGYINVILSINRLNNPDVLTVGNTILLPVEAK